MKIILFHFILLFIIPGYGYCQQLYYPLNQDFIRIIESKISEKNQPSFISFKAVLQSNVSNLPGIDSALYYNPALIKFIDARKFKTIWGHILYEDLVSVKTNDFYLGINPIAYMEFGKDLGTDSGFKINTRAIEFKAHIGKKFSIYSSFYENQAFYPDYINEQVNKTSVVPGQGPRKDFGKGGHDFSMSSAYISFSPNKYMNFTLGHDKHFIGNGYRSLLLSDNAFNYPFLKANFKYRNFQYILLFTEFQNFNGVYYNYHHKKHGTYTFLSWLPFPGLELNLFESFIWKTSDSTYTNSFNSDMLKQVILFRALKYGLADNHNTMLGLNARYNMLPFSQIYGQLVVDDFKPSQLFKGRDYFRNKFGYQLGIKYFDLFHNKLYKQFLYLQAEYNTVKPYTYAHTLPNQSYTHMNQALAHPLGAGFREIISIIDYRYYIIGFNYKFTFALTSRDTMGTNSGIDIFKSDLAATRGMNSFGNYIGNGLKTTISHHTFTLKIRLKRRTNMNIFAGIDFRSYSNRISKLHTDYIFTGIRSSMNNLYFDF